MTASSGFISEDEFFDEWAVQASLTGDLFDYRDVVDKSRANVWTIVESGDDLDETWYALPGFHFVNRLGYVMTARPWNDTTPDAIYFLDNR